MGYSSSPSLGRAALIAEHGNEQVGDAGLAHVAKRGELLAFDTIEQQDAAPEHLAFVNRPERPCCAELFGMHHQFRIAQFEFFHVAIEYDATAIDEDGIGQDVLNLFNLRCGHHDCAATSEVVVQQRIVELLAIQDVESKCRLVQYPQFRVNGHDQGEMQL